MALKITLLTFPGFTANCYFVFDEETKESFLVDPGAYGKRHSEYIKSQGIEKLSYILLTHGHFDHIMGVSQFKEDLGGQIVIHEKDADCLSSPLKSLAITQGLMLQKTQADITVKDGDTLSFAGGEIEVIHTPGHTKGCVCYKLGELLFTGDTLFRGTVGRTDFPGGSYSELSESMKKLKALEGDYKVYPGHEELTTLENERRNNPHMEGK
ncbi:MAG: MBL fold metallo-hydrolase [Clostridia bacterium]|nr:MBL fold metallo-hydrolase [Clostridia bacterium]